MRCAFILPTIVRCQSLPSSIRVTAHQKIELEDINMQINLRKLYPQYYNKDYFVEVPDILAEQFVQWDREEQSHKRNRYCNKAHYSLDCDDGIEHDVLLVALSPCEIYERSLHLSSCIQPLLCCRKNRGGGSTRTTSSDRTRPLLPGLRGSAAMWFLHPSGADSRS